MKIAVAGAGYVGLSNAILLAQHHDVVLVDPDESKVKKINNRISPIDDVDISYFLENISLSLIAIGDEKMAYQDAEFVFIATPTNYDEKTKKIDTSTVENVISTVKGLSKNAAIIIKSTVPIGFTQKISESLMADSIYFSPEFLREGKALHDCLYPSRIVIGVSSAQSKNNDAERIAELLNEGTKNKNSPILIIGSTEAEAIKLFSNSYLAMRVSFFNEIDNYAEIKGLNTKDIITGVGLDPRIGSNYNNPSFGYGGYCLPKDTKQLLANYSNVPQNLISAIVESNETRKKHIVSQILKRNPKVVGIYRLIMKSNSDNFRESSIQSIMNKLNSNNVKVVIYEPLVETERYGEYDVIKDLTEFIAQTDVILVNRLAPEIMPFMEKVYTRDLFSEN